MKVLDLTLPTPAENLALDEALLLEAEASDPEDTLRFWMSPKPFVVLGLGGQWRQETNSQACRTRSIPIHRRCSGGGTVVQGPGCLNYALILNLASSSSFASVGGTNRTVMERNASALGHTLGQSVRVEGHSDLVLAGRKFSGNAQRRMRNHLLFHGTFLLNCDLNLITDLLPCPAAQPEYRRQRSHQEFLANLQLAEDTVKQALASAWSAAGVREHYPADTLHQLVQSRYTNPTWNLRR